MVFERELLAVQKAINLERWILTSLAGGAILGTFAPHFLPHTTNQEKSLLLGTGLMSSIAFTAAVRFRTPKENLYTSLQESQKESFKNSLSHTISYEEAIDNIEAYRRLGSYVSTLPVHEQGRWVEEYGLHSIIAPPPVAERVAAPQADPVTVSPYQPNIDEAMGETNNIDYSWIDQKFIEASKGVFGAKGSGKSRWFAYESVMFLAYNPGGTLLIGDLHYDPEHSDWFPGVPPAVAEQLFIATRPEKVLKQFRFVAQQLKHRVDNGLKKEQRIKFICDEFVATMSRFEDEEREEVLQTIMLTQYEGRKYGVDITLGLHSVKKEICGVDSSVLANMDLLCLGKSLADPTNKMPADFNARELVKAQTTMQNILQPGQGYACVVRKLGDSPGVEVIPHIDLDQLKLDLKYDPIQLMRDWVRDKKVSDSAIAERWKEYTGKELNEAGLQELKEKIAYA